MCLLQIGTELGGYELGSPQGLVITNPPSAPSLNLPHATKERRKPAGAKWRSRVTAALSKPLTPLSKLDIRIRYS